MELADIDGIMARRRSVRDYEARPVDEGTLGALRDFLGQEATDHEGRPVRIQLIEDGGLSGGQRLGTYGTIKGARLFLVGSLDPQQTTAEGFGYAFEKVVLEATRLGLGTCWLAGTLNRGSFATSARLGEGEILAVVSPLGYAADTTSFRDRLTRGIAGSDKRKPAAELFYGLDAHDLERFARPLAAVRGGPSASNRQPWRIERVPGGFRFGLVRTPGYGQAFGFDIQRSDVGIAMAHFDLSARASGIQGLWNDEGGPVMHPRAGEYVITWREQNQ